MDASPAYNKPSMDGTSSDQTYNTGDNGKSRAIDAHGDKAGATSRPTQLPPTDNAAVQHAAGQGLITVQPLRKSEMQPSYAQDMGADNDQGCYGGMINTFGLVCGTLGSVPLCFCFPNPFREVQQGSVGLISRFGKFYKSVDPGLVKVNPFSEKLKVVDVKIQLAVIPRQNVITRDNVNVDIDSVLVYHVVAPYKAAYGITDVRLALIERAQTTLRQVVGTRNLQNLLEEREAIAAEIETIVESVSEKWGVRIESLLIKDVVFSEELQQSLSSAAAAKRVGEAKVIAARAEVDSAHLFREAADILSSEAAIQIRQLDALQNMARQSGSKVIFVPMNLMSVGVAGGPAGATGAGASGPGPAAGIATIEQLSRMG